MKSKFRDKNQNQKGQALVEACTSMVIIISISISLFILMGIFSVKEFSKLFHYQFLICIAEQRKDYECKKMLFSKIMRLPNTVIQNIKYSSHTKRKIQYFESQIKLMFFNIPIKLQETFYVPKF